MDSAAFKHIIVENTAVATIVTFKDRKILDEDQIKELGQELNAVQDESNVPLILHFMDVEFISSAAMGKFITLDKRAKYEGKKLILDAIIPEIYEVFCITRLDKRFEIHDDLESALASLPEPS